MQKHLKKYLSRHRYSWCMSLLWSCIGYIIFVAIVTTKVFKPIVLLWQANPGIILPLYFGMAASIFVVSFLMMSARKFPYSNRYEVLISFSCASKALLLIGLASTRQFYSVTVLGAFIVFEVVWLGLEVLYRARFVGYRFAVFPTNIQLTSKDFPEYRITFTYSRQEIENNGIDALIIEDEGMLDKEWGERLSYCRSLDIPVIPLEYFLENVWGRVPLDVISETPDINAVYSNWYMYIKTFTDKILAVFGLIVLLPIFIVIAGILKLTSAEPVFFKQNRVGLNGKIFAMYKFRTMNGKVEMDGTNAGKKRITRFGGLLRRSHFDELPQLLNVLKGDLSLVGPRPETPELTAHYKKNIRLYGLRTKIKQGVVGWALIHQGNVSGIEDTRIKLSYDLYYMKRASLFLDVYIILKSFWLMLFGIEQVKTPDKLGVFSGKS